MAETDSFPWHCTQCGRLNGKKHDNCPTCRQHWTKGIRHDNTPKSPRSHASQTTPNYQANSWEWYGGGNQKNKSKSKGDRSESARRRKGKGKGGQGKQGTAQPSPFAQPAQIPPWPTLENAQTSNQQTPIAPAPAVANSEYLAAIRKAYPDISQAPEDIQKIVEKSDKIATKTLSTDLNKASKQVGQAARQVSTIKEARTAHRQSWLKHLKDSVVSWQKQLQLFKDQQQTYGDQLTKAQHELNQARRHLQQLNKQAAAVGTPTAETGDLNPEHFEADTTATFEAEAQALVAQVQESLQQSIAAASAPIIDFMEINTDEEDGDRLKKRPRSMEPFGGPHAAEPSLPSPTS